MSRMRELYETTVKSELISRFEYANQMKVPRLEKIVLNMGVGEASQDSKKIAAAAEELTAIAGQKPVIMRAWIPTE